VPPPFRDPLEMLNRGEAVHPQRENPLLDQGDEVDHLMASLMQSRGNKKYDANARLKS
jgi:hypothetical protein